MKKEPHVARGECSDRRDFLVAQATLKLEVDDFTLITRERLENIEDATKGLAGVVLRVEVVDDRNLDVFERCRARRLLACIQRQVPADGEQPRRHVLPDSLRILPAEAEEGFLDDIPRRLQVA